MVKQGSASGSLERTLVPQDVPASGTMFIIVANSESTKFDTKKDLHFGNTIVPKEQLQSVRKIQLAGAQFKNRYQDTDNIDYYLWNYIDEDGEQYIDSNGVVNRTHVLASGVTVRGNVEEEGPYFKYCEVITAHTLMRCETVPGTGTNHTLFASIDEQHSNLKTQALRYSKPIIFDIKNIEGDALDKANTKGIDVAIVSGKNFGQIDNNRADIFGFYDHEPEVFTGINCTVTKEHEVMECVLSEGVGKRQSWEVVIDEQNSTSPTSSYEVPIIYSITGPGAVNADGNGGQWIVIEGENFGPVDFHNRPSGFLEKVTFGEQGDEYKVCDLDAEHLRCVSRCVTDICVEEGKGFWSNHKEITIGTREFGCTHLGHTMINCTTVPAIGKKVFWQVTVGRQKNELNDNCSTSFADPNIQILVPTASRTLPRPDEVVLLIGEYIRRKTVLILVKK